MRYSDENGVPTATGAAAMSRAQDRARMTRDEREAERLAEMDGVLAQCELRSSSATTELRHLANLCDGDKAARLLEFADEIDAMEWP